MSAVLQFLFTPSHYYSIPCHCQTHVFSEHEGSVNSIAWAPHEYGLILACASSDGSISIHTHRSDGSWDTARLPQAHPVGATSVSWAPSTAPGSLFGSVTPNPVLRLVSGGCDNLVKVWRREAAADGAAGGAGGGSWKLEVFPGLARHSDWVRDVAWAPNLGLPKTTIASASQVREGRGGEGRGGDGRGREE